MGKGESPVRPAMRLVSPWSSSDLETIVWSDIFGADDLPVTRAECMAIPAVAKARHLIAGVSRFPLQTYRGDVELPNSTWIYRTDTQEPPQLRMMWTLDDLLFYGWSLWAVERGTNGAITDAMRVPQDWWDFDGDSTKILVHGDEVTAESAVLIPGPFEGIMKAGAHTIRAAHDLEKAWARRTRNPVPAVELHQTDDTPATDPEKREIIRSWASMLDDGGGAAWTPYNIDVRTHGETAADLFVQGRNAVTLDIGRLTNVPAMLLDAALATSSLQYTTSVDGRNAFNDITIAYWITSIEARLSMDDVVPRGQRVGFDLADLVQVPTPTASPITED